MDSKRLYHSTPTHTHSILKAAKCSLCAWLAKMVDFLRCYRLSLLKSGLFQKFSPNICLFLLADTLFYALCLTFQMPVTTRAKENKPTTNQKVERECTVNTYNCCCGLMFKRSLICVHWIRFRPISNTLTKTSISFCLRNHA